MAGGGIMLSQFLTFCVLIVSSLGDSVISGYGPVNLEDLHPLTLSWNQVEQASILLSFQHEIQDKN